MVNFIKKLIGSGNQRQLNQIQKIVDQIEALETEYEGLSNEQLQSKTDEFKERYNNGASLDYLLIEAYATVREASKRVLKMRPFAVQLIGAIVLHRGNIAEMKTGEGKTLDSTIPA